MLAVLDGALLLLACALALPAAVFSLECLVGALSRVRPTPVPSLDDVRTLAVLVPAHDESAVLARTLRGIRRSLRPHDVLLVVADNCTDDTAEVAAREGALVAVRDEPQRRGKGYALAFGILRLEPHAPDLVVIVDADCDLDDGALARIASLAQRTGRPVQADYVLRAVQGAHGRAAISALALLVKNRTRPRGLHALGLPCLLTGTGMAFPWPVLRRAPPTEGHLAEDMVMGLQLAELGHAPLLCPQARVTSELPARVPAAHAQRRRWEHGHLSTLVSHAPRLLWRALRTGRLGLAALALDLLVPPLSLLVAQVTATCFASGAAFAVARVGGRGLALSAASLCGMALAVLLAWLAHGRRTLGARDLLAVPGYVLWKLPLYATFFARGRHAHWERTARERRDD